MTRFVLPNDEQNRPIVDVESADSETVWAVYTSKSGDSALTLKVKLDVVPFTSDAQGFEDILYSGTVAHYAMINGEDEVETFNMAGQLERIERRGGLALTITRDPHLIVEDDFGRQMSVEFGFDDPDLYTSNVALPYTLKKMIAPGGAEYVYRSEFLYAGEISGGIARHWAGNVAVEFPSNLGDTALTREYSYDFIPFISKLSGMRDERGVDYVSWAYDDEGRATSSQLAGGVGANTLSFSGDTTTLVNPLGKQSIFHFGVSFGRKRLSQVEGIVTQNCEGAVRNQSYDAMGNISSRTDWKNNRQDTVFNSRGLVELTEVAVGTSVARTITTLWHEIYRVPVSVTTPDTVTVYEYDNSGNLISRAVSDVEGTETRTTSWTYNGFGQVLTEDGPRQDVSDITTYTYYSCSSGLECGQLQTITNALGHTTTFNAYDAHGYPLSITDANGVLTQLTYDNRQRLTSVAVDTSTTTFSYDATGNLIRVALGDGTFTDYLWDDASRLIALLDSEGNRVEWALDSAGNRTEETLKDPQGAVRKSLQRSYDELSRLIGVLPSHGGTTQYRYDTNSNLTGMTDASSRETTRAYDALNRLTSIQDALLASTLFAYDTQDNVTSVTDAEGLITQYTYNRFGDRLTLNSPDTGLSQYTYDAAGNQLTMTDARNVLVSYNYDALNRLTGVAYSDTSLNIAYSYDQGVNGVGRLTGITDGSGTTSYTYDARGNVTSLTQTILGHSYTQTYSYNDADRLTGMLTPSGRVISYIYDISGRIVQVSSERNGQTEVLADNIERLPFGPMIGLTLGNGLLKSRSYDLDYRVQNINDDSVLARNYGYSPVDNITAITDSINPALSQLFSYDDLNRLEFASGNYGDISYGYDGVGNRLSLTTSRKATARRNPTSMKRAVTGCLLLLVKELFSTMQRVIPWTTDWRASLITIEIDYQ